MSTDIKTGKRQFNAPPIHHALAGLVYCLILLGTDGARAQDGTLGFIEGTGNAREFSGLAVQDPCPAAGYMTHVQSLVDEINLPNLEYPGSIVVSPDGRHVYAGSTIGYAFYAFSRNLSSGELTSIQVIEDWVTGVQIYRGAKDTVVSPDGRYVYHMSSLSFWAPTIVSLFRRDVQSGILLFWTTSVALPTERMVSTKILRSFISLKMGLSLSWRDMTTG